MGLKNGGLRGSLRNIGTGGAVIPDSVVDHFESAVYEDKDRGLTDYYSGDLADYARGTSNVVQGAYGLETTDASGNNTAIYSVPGDGLPRYPQAGDTIGFLIRDLSGQTFPGVGFSINSSGSGYWFGITTDTFSIFKGDFPFVDPVQQSSPSVSVDTWYWGEVDTPTSTGDMEARLYNVDTSDLTRGSLIETLTATDTDFAGNRGVGFGEVGNQAGVCYDWYRVL